MIRKLFFVLIAITVCIPSKMLIKDSDQLADLYCKATLSSLNSMERCLYSFIVSFAN